MRADISLEKMATLKTAFDKSERGTLTAANSTPLTDGAAACCWRRRSGRAQRGLPVLAYLTHGQTSANNFVAGDGLLMAPTIAVAKMLNRAGLKLQDFDFYEIHEAFAAQVLCYAEGLGRSATIARTLLGRTSRSARSTGPRSTSWARRWPTAIRSRRPAPASPPPGEAAVAARRRGLISVCTAGGMGVAAILEAAK